MNSFVALMLSLLVLSISSFGFAGTEFQVQTKKLSAKNWVEVLKLSCDEGDATCELVCQNRKTCELPQMACVDCVSQTNRLIQTVFRNLKALYVANTEKKKSSIDVVEHLRHSRFFVLATDSYLNVFTPKALELNRKAFNGLCPNENALVRDSLLVVELDSSLSATKISHVICQYASESEVIALDFNPLFTNSAIPNEPAVDSQHSILLTTP